MAREAKKTGYKGRRTKAAAFDWDAFLHEAAGRVLESGDLSPEVRDIVERSEKV